MNQTNNPPDANRDPITKEPGAHPVGTATGAAVGGAVGVAAGGMAGVVAGIAAGTVVGGPIGAVAGAALGAIGGGLMGKGIAEKVNPTEEDAYWRTNYTTRPYVEKSLTYDDYQPAYRVGYEGFDRHAGKNVRYETIESELQRAYEGTSANKRLGWDKAKSAARDAWTRLEETRSGNVNSDKA